MGAFAWMAWTWQTALFFAFIVAVLIAMTLWERASPSGEHVGVLRIATTRGDRLFISLLGSAFIHLAWLGLIGPDVPLYWATLISLVYATGVFRWV
jgi:predicted small integral membrane protein